VTESHTAADAPPALPELVRRLAGHRPTRVTDPAVTGGWQAATAVVLAPGPTGVSLAVIERTQRPGDAWSGQMALPGGRRDPGDRDLATTAAREAHEEVGLRLDVPVARLADQWGRTRRGPIATYVFALDHLPALRPQPSEVANAWWLPIRALIDPGRRVAAPRGGGGGITHQGRVIWGLTGRILREFAAASGLVPAAVGRATAVPVQPGS